MYLMLASRPDLCYAVGYLSRFQDCATEAHWTHLKHIMRYLKGTSDLKLVYKRSESDPLIGYADSDRANDTCDRKSTSGFLFQVYGNTILWSSKKTGYNFYHRSRVCSSFISQYGSDLVDQNVYGFEN